MNSATLNTPRAPISLNCTPALAAEAPVSCQTAWLSRLTITSSPGRVRTRSATWFAIVPLGSQSAASLPSRRATRSCSALMVGSSPYWSSPTGAAAMAARIPGVGRVTVSERRSIVSDVPACPFELGMVIGRDLDEIRVRIAEIHGMNRTLCAGFGYGTLDDRNAAAGKVGDHLRQRNRRDQAEIRRARRARVRLGLEFAPRLVQVDLLPADQQGLASHAEGPHAHAEHARIERAGGFDVTHREDDMVAAIDIHRLRQRIACPREISSRAGQED